MCRKTIRAPGKPDLNLKLVVERESCSFKKVCLAATVAAKLTHFSFLAVFISSASRIAGETGWLAE